MSKQLRCFLLLFLAWAGIANAVDLRPDMSPQLNASAFQYLIEDQPLTRADILARSDLPWQEVGRSGINLDVQTTAVWIRFPVRNDSDQPARWNLLMPWGEIAHMDFALLRENGLPDQIFESGYEIERSALPVDYRIFLFPLQFEPHEKAEILMRVRIRAIFFLPLIMMTQDEFEAYERNSNLTYGIGFGILLAMMLYNLSLYIFIRERTYLAYSVYVFSIILYELALTGYGAQYLWRDWAWMRANGYSISAGFSFLSAVIFGRLFLQLHRYGGWYLGLNTFMMWYWSIAIVFNLMGWMWFIIYTVNQMALVSCVIAVVTTIALWRKGNRSARYFTVAWGFVFSSTVVSVLMVMGFLPFNAITENAQMAGFSLELLLLSFALAERISREREQRVSAQQHALQSLQQLDVERNAKLAAQSQTLQIQQRNNEELELRVLDRTAELERAMKNLELANRELAKLSVTDPLTRLNNRRYFDETLQAELSRAVRTGQSLALILVDIDHFKSINDTYGHLVGDECLKLVAVTLKQVVNRSTDLVARYGGEEFAVVLPATSENDAVQIANRIRSAIERVQFIHAGKRISISASLGVAGRQPTTFDTPNRFITASDEALYRAKETGRNRVVAAQLADAG